MRLLIPVLALLLGGCATTATHAPPRSSPVAATAAPEAPAGKPETSSLWDRMRQNRGLASLDHPLVRAQQVDLARDTRHLNSLSERAEPFLHYILEQTDERGLPAEIALIPMIESGFRPDAVSPGRAAGLWQIRPATGRNLGLTINGAYDGRHDIRESTTAALNYLEYLHALFDHDWLLAVAAYNSGEGTVRRAIEHNRRAGKATDFWNLKLPRVTREYVPKLLALSRVLSEPDVHGIALPETPDAPYLKEVPVPPGLSLRMAATEAGISLENLRFFNPGLKAGSTPEHMETRILLPRRDARTLARMLGPQTRVGSEGRDGEYEVRPGDTLTAIAMRHRVDLNALARLNGLGVTSMLMPGQTLVLAPSYRSPH